MSEPRLDRYTRNGVTLLGDTSRPGGVTFAFTERTGGVSPAPYASLDFGTANGDDPDLVAENRRRALAALGAQDHLANLVSPRQVHGDVIVTVDSADPASLDRARSRASAGADGVVCTAVGVPVLLGFADCVPVVLTAPGGFAVVHSGWRGTIARIAGAGVDALCAATGVGPSEVNAYLGPHVMGEDYEVSEGLLARFVDEFGTMVMVPGRPRNLALGPAIVSALAAHGVKPCNTLDSKLSTVRNLARFYSYRAEGGVTGRHAAIAWLAPSGR
ncbi:MAG: polyphenol oxidase family protein [Atopobiaceae bacterium]|jgi:YfiH family protein|nr:polyphenol oxidase family protein [Atopobiaceae bacterium]